jgi:hypothetical protein
MVEKFEKKFLGTWWVKERYCQKLGVPPDVSQACFEIITLLNLGLISL